MYLELEVHTVDLVQGLHTHPGPVKQKGSPL